MAIYLDYNATTPVDPRVKEAMLPYFTEKFGNPASMHSYGWEADAAVKKSRQQVADLIQCSSDEIFFTSGATETNNLAIQGQIYPFLMRREPAHIITSMVEHKCVLDVSRALEKMGAELTILAPSKDGIITADQVIGALKPHTKLVSIIHGQNEIGSLNDIKSIGLALKKKGIPFHTDAAQSVGKIPINVNDMGIDLLSASGQKMYAPKGIGFFYKSKSHSNLDIQPIMWGGAQECGVRPGTLNVPGIVGVGMACEIAKQEMNKDAEKIGALQKRLIDKALSLSDKVKLNGSRSQRLYSNVSLTLKDVSSDDFALGLSGLAVSTTSACSGGSVSHVLTAIGHSEQDAKSTVRMGLGRWTTEEHIDVALEKLKKLLVS